MKKHPMQPVVDVEGVQRFQQNGIIRLLFERGFIDLNTVLSWEGLSTEDVEQLYQLLGYSITGYCDLSRVSDASKDEAWAEAVLLTRKGNGS